MFYQQLSDILTTSPGNLTFHLVTAFAIIWALQAAISRWSLRRSSRSMRLVLGFSILFAVRLGLFAFAAIFNQEAGALSLLPPVDRAVNFFGVLVIVWLWCFPEKNRFGDVSFVLLSILDVVFLVVNLIGWQGHNPELTFNASLLSPIWEGFSAGLCAAGIVMLLSKRTRNWGLGFSILSVNLVGHLFSLIAPVLGANYPVAVRVAQLITYPLLYTLTLDLNPRHAHSEAASAPEPSSFLETDEAGPSFSFPAPLLELARLVNLGGQDVFPAVIEVLCVAVQADAGLILAPLEDENRVPVLGVFSPGETKVKSGDHFSIKQLPLILHAVQRTRPIILPADNNARDLVNLKAAFGWEKNAHTLCVPLHDEVNNPLGTVILMRRQSPWIAQDQETAASAAGLCYQIASQKPGGVQVSATPSESEILQEALVLAEEDKNSPKAQNYLEQYNLLKAKTRQVFTLNQELKALVATLENDNKRLQETEDQLKKSVFSRQEEYNRFTRLEEEIKSKDARLVQSKQREQEAITALETYREKITQIVRMEKDLQTITRQNEIQQAEIKSLTAEIALIPGLGQHETELQALLTRVQTQNQELVGALQSAEKEAQKVPILLQQEKKMRAALAQAEVRSKERLQEAEENQKERLRLAHELDEMKAALSKANKTLEKLQKDTSRTEQKALQAREQIAQLTSQQMAEIASSVQELRYPLSTIVDYSDLVLDESVGPLGALQKKFLERLKEGVTQLEDQINLVVQTIVMDSTKLSLSKQKFDLQPVIDTLNASLQDLLREKSITLQVAMPPEPLTIQTDKSALEKILLILSHNALQVTPPKGKTRLEVSRVDDEQKKQFALFQVTDSGEGIPAEDIPQVFSSSYQSAHRTVGGTADTEMGLPVAKTLTEAIHGQIWVESEPRKGTRFSVLIPLKSEDGENPVHNSSG